MNHYAGKVVVVAQDNLMKARDERVALMNEVRECYISDLSRCLFITFFFQGLGSYPDAEGIIISYSNIKGGPLPILPL